MDVVCVNDNDVQTCANGGVDIMILNRSDIGCWQMPMLVCSVF